MRIPRRPKHADWYSTTHPHRPDGMTTEEVAAALGISRGRVQQLEYRALGKLMARAVEEGMTLEDLLPDGPEGETWPDGGGWEEGEDRGGIAP